MKNKLILTIGAPGSGKSTYIQNYIKSHPETIILSSDALRAKFGRDESDQSVTGAVFSYIKRTLPTLLASGKSVILDATNINAKDRKDHINAGLQNGCEIIAWVFERNKELLVQRNKERGEKGGRNVPEFVIDKMLTKYQRPSQSEGFDEIEYIG